MPLKSCRSSCLAAPLCLLMFASVVRSDEPDPKPTKDETVTFYTEQVKPILEAHCWKCHGGEKQIKGGLNLTHRDGLLQGGDLGPSVDLKNPGESVLLEALAYEGLEMPPAGKLPREQIQTIKRWIELGLPWPKLERAAAPHPEEREAQISVDQARREHWAFQPVSQPDVPRVKTLNWASGSIDPFVLNRLESAGLQPNPPASKRALIRRAYFDLIGLPPSPDTVKSFLKDAHPEAYERMLDRLLASPQYGEHWARHWLDLVRYAETNSFERDNAKPNVWRYRDYVVQSFNDDKPYDQFITEQLAGDELDSVSAESIIATGYYRLGLWDDEPTDAIQAYYDHLDDVITITSQVVMGLTINCARCHDHKIDPIPQADYYRFMGFFHNIYKNTRTEGATAFKSPFTLNTEREIATDEQRAEYTAFKQQFEQKLKQQRETLAQWEAQIVDGFSNPEKEDARDAEVRKRLIEQKGSDALGEAKWAEFRTLRDTIAKAKLPAPQFPMALAIRENGPRAPDTHILIRGNPHAPGDKVEPGYPDVLGFAAPEFPARGADAASCGRRHTLAKWLMDPAHPLTARVMANRLWQHHFGRGIVRSASDFGLKGTPPTHPELLDFLAAELVRGDWHLKRMHKLIMMSSTYRMSSAPNAKALAADPQNNLLWRVEMRRLSSEQLRDALLSVNGLLNTAMGGPSIYPKIPAAVLQGQSRPGAGWGNSSPEDMARRSIYVFIKRSLSVPLLATFDSPDTDFSCPVRFITTQPTQALTLLNSDFIVEQAKAFATDLRRTYPHDTSLLINAALTRALGREPEAHEIERSQKLLHSLESEYGLSQDVAIDQFCLMVFNLNEFMYLD